MCLLGTIGFTNLGRIEKVYFFLNSEISFKIVKFGRNCDGFILVVLVWILEGSKFNTSKYRFAWAAKKQITILI